MIIDVHYHLMPRVTEKSVAHLLPLVLRAAEAMGKSVDPETLARRALEEWGDPTGERLIASMDEAGIDLTVICMVDDARQAQLGPESVQRGNRIVGHVAARYPGRVVGLAGIDPRRPEAPAMLKQCLDEFGVRGMKYHPDYGFDPAGPDSYRVLEVLARHNGLLLTHTGPLPPPSRNSYSDPRRLSDLAVDFPEITVIAAHMGAAEWRSWANLAAHQPTLYGDLAMWDMLAFRRYELFCRELRGVLDFAGPSKVLFGTDDPIYSVIEPKGTWVRLIRDLPTNAPEGIVFTRKEVDGILGGNAASILGIE